MPVDKLGWGGSAPTLEDLDAMFDNKRDNTVTPTLEDLDAMFGGKQGGRQVAAPTGEPFGGNWTDAPRTGSVPKSVSSYNDVLSRSYIPGFTQGPSPDDMRRAEMLIGLTADASAPAASTFRPPAPYTVKPAPTTPEEMDAMFSGGPEPTPSEMLQAEFGKRGGRTQFAPKDATAAHTVAPATPMVTPRPSDVMTPNTATLRQGYSMVTPSPSDVGTPNTGTLRQGYNSAGNIPVYSEVEFEPEEVEPVQPMPDKDAERWDKAGIVSGLRAGAGALAGSQYEALGDAYKRQPDIDADAVERGRQLAETTGITPTGYLGTLPVLPDAAKRLPTEDYGALTEYYKNEQVKRNQERGARYSDKAQELYEGAREKYPIEKIIAENQEKARKAADMEDGHAKAFVVGGRNFLNRVVFPYMVGVDDKKNSKDNQEAMLRLVHYLDDVQTQNTESASGLQKHTREAAGQVAAMTPGFLAAALGFIPGVGPALGSAVGLISKVAWTLHGATETLEDMEAQGGDLRKALGTSILAGMVYTDIENRQVKGIAKLGLGKTAKQSVGKTATSIAGNAIKEWFKNMGEEGMQGATVVDAAAQALRAQGYDISTADIVKSMNKRFGEEAVGSAWSMAVIVGAGSAVGAGRAAVNLASGNTRLNNAVARENAETIRQSKQDFDAMDAGTYQPNPQVQPQKQGTTARVAPTTTGQNAQFAGRGMDDAETRENAAGIDDNGAGAAELPPDAENAATPVFDVGTEKRGADDRRVDERRAQTGQRGEETDLSVEDEAEERLLNEHYEKLEREENERIARGEPPKAERPHVDWTQKDADLGGIIAQQNARVEQFAPVREQLLTPTIGADGDKILNSISDPNAREAARANMVAEVKKQLDTYTAKHGLKGYDFTDNMRLEEAYDKLLESNTPFVVEALDIGNLGGLNTALDNNHEAADEHLRGVFGDIYIDTVNRLGGVIGKFGGDEFVTLWVGYDNVDEVRDIRDTIENKLRAERNTRELGKIAYPKGDKLPTGALHTASGFIKGRNGVPFTVARAAAEAGAEKKKELYLEDIKKRLENVNNLPYNYNKGGTQNEHRSETQTVGNTGRPARGRTDGLSSQDNSQNISGGLRGVDKGRGRVREELLLQEGESNRARTQSQSRDGVTESATAPLSQEARAELNNLSPEVQNELRKRGLNFASRETQKSKPQNEALNNSAPNSQANLDSSSKNIRNGQNDTADIDSFTDADIDNFADEDAASANESPADRDIRDILEAEFGAPLPAGSVQVSDARFAPWIHDVVKKVFNIDIVVVDADHDAIAAVSPTGDSFDGFYSAKTPDVIYIASDTKRPLFQVISHELWHSLERNADLKAQVEAALRLTSAGRKAMLREGSSEFTADYVFGKALEDRAFWRHLAAKNIVERFARDTIDALRRLYVAMKRASEDVDRATTGRYMTTEEFEDREGIGDHLMNMRELFDQLSRAIKEAKGETGTAQAAAVAERFRAITGGAAAETIDVKITGKDTERGTHKDDGGTKFAFIGQRGAENMDRRARRRKPEKDDDYFQFARIMEREGNWNESTRYDDILAITGWALGQKGGWNWNYDKEEAVWEDTHGWEYEGTTPARRKRVLGLKRNTRWADWVDRRPGMREHNIPKPEADLDSPTAHDNMKIAEEMEKAGKDEKAIKMATGWERGADGKWRYEIPDILFSDNARQLLRDERRVRLGDVVGDDRGLFTAYPQLRDITVKTDENMRGEAGYYDRANSAIVISADAEPRGNLINIFVHEIQHAIQHIEGFARGGSPREFDPPSETEQNFSKFHDAVERLKGDAYENIGIILNDDILRYEFNVPEELESMYKKLDKNLFMDNYRHIAKSGSTWPMQQYHRLAGETEARNVEKRQMWVESARRSTLARDTEDVSREEQNVRFAKRDEASEFGSAVEAGVPAEHFEKYSAARKRVRDEWTRAQTRSPFFKKWFGDWEKDPEGASKVVDKGGEPLKVYHGTLNGEFTTFKSAVTGRGHYFFTKSQRVAKQYASKKYSGDKFNLINNGGAKPKGHIFEVFLNIRHPLIIDASGNSYLTVPYGDGAKSTHDIAEIEKGKQQYDGVIIKNIRDNATLTKDTIYIAFSPNQIKSATDNVGTFDSGNPDIRFARRGGKGLPSMEEARQAIPEGRRRYFEGIWDRGLKVTQATMNDPKNNRPIFLPPPTRRLKDELARLFGRNVKAEKQSITFERAYHINERHGTGNETDKSQRPVTRETFALIPDVLENFDSVTKKPNNSVRISKQYSDGRMVIADAVLSDGNLEIKTLWIKSPAGTNSQRTKADGMTTLNSPHPSDVPSPRLNVRNEGAVLSDFDNKISDSAPKVNRENEKNQKSSSDNRAARYSPDDDPAPITPRQFRRLLDRLGRTGLAKDVITDADEMRKRLSRTFGEGAADRFMSVWHGSPHAFDRFSTAFMGTGEGNQSYGWGLYFTEVDDIARHYGKVSTTWHDGEPLSAFVYRGKRFVERIKNGERIYENSKTGVALDPASILYKVFDDLRVFGDKTYVRETAVDRKRFAVNPTMIKDYLEALADADISHGNLYNVKIHGDKMIDDLNFIRWDKPLTDKQWSAVLSEMEKSKAGKTPHEAYRIDRFVETAKEHWRDASGETIYRNLDNHFISDKAASEFLLRAGIDGIQYPTGFKSKGSHEDSYNYVVFDDKALEIVEHIRLMSTPDDEVYGFATKDGKIYLDPAKMNANTPIHEYGHLWIDFAKKHNNPLYKRIVYAAAQSEFYKELKANPAYAHLSHTERAEEATARAIADAGEVRFLNERGLEKFKQFLHDLWDWVAERLGLSGRYRAQPDLGDVVFLGNLTLEELAEGAARELLGGREIGEAENDGTGGENYISGDDSERAGQEVAKKAEMYKNGMSREDARAKLSALIGGRQQWVTLRNDNDGEEVVLSNPSVGKMLSATAVRKSEDNGFTKGQHCAVASDISDLFRKSFKIFSHPDKNGYKDITIHRFAAPLHFNDAVAYITVKESTQHGKRIYSAELMEIGKLEGTLAEVRQASHTPPSPSFNEDNILKLRNAVKKIERLTTPHTTPAGERAINTPNDADSQALFNKKAPKLFKTVGRFLQNVGHGSSEAINNNIGDFSENVNSKIKKSENIFEGEDGDSDDLRFARRTVSPAERERRAKDPRWRITEELRKILSSAGIINFGDALANWGAIPKSVKNDTDARRKWESKWARAEDAFTHYARNNPELFVDAGFPEAMDTGRGLEDRFDPQDVIYKIPEWLNDFDSGNYVSADAANEDADPIIAGARRAAFDSLTEGLAPHERETQYWDGHYNMPELEKAPIERLGRQSSKGGRVTFTNAGEEFTARRAQSTGGWIIENARGLREELEAGASVWVDKGHLQTAEREASAKDAEADVKRAEAAIKKAESKKSDADAKKAEADARKAEATAAAETARAEANKLSSEAAMARAQAATAEAEKAKAEADKASSEAEKAKAERDSAREETRKARAEADKVKAELQTAKNKVWEARAKADEAKAKLRKAKRTRKETAAEVMKKLAAHASRLNAIRGKRASTMDIDANRRLENMVKNLQSDINGSVRKAIELFQNQAIKDIKNNPDRMPKGYGRSEFDDDITRWREGGGGLPGFVQDAIVASMQEDLAYLTTEQMRETLSAIEEIEESGRARLEIEQFGRMLKIEAEAGKILSALGVVDKKPEEITKQEKNAGKFGLDMRQTHVIADEKARRNAAVKAADNARENLNNAKFWALRPETITRVLDGTAGFEDKMGPMERYIFTRILNAYKNRLIATERAEAMIAKTLESINTKTLTDTMTTAKIMAKDGTVSTEEKEITYDEAMFVYGHSQSESGLNHLRGSGYMDDEAHGRDSMGKIIDALPKEYKAAVDAVIDYFDNDQYPRMNPVFAREHHIDMYKEPRYMPIRNLEQRDKSAAELIAGEDAMRRAHASVSKGMTKTRINSDLAFTRPSFFGTIVPAIRETEHYIAMNDAVREVSRLLNHRRVNMALQQKSPGALKNLDKWLKSAASGRQLMEDDPAVQAALWLKRNATVGTLGANLLVMMKQLDSVVQGTVRIKGGFWRVPRALFYDPVMHREAREFAIANSVFLRNRAHGIERAWTDRENVAKVDRYLRARLGKRLLKADIKGAVDTLREWSMYLCQAADMWIVTSLWNARYEEVYNRLIDKGINAGQAQETATNAADTLIRRTQPLFDKVLQPTALRGENALVAMFNMYLTQQNQNLNNAVEILAGAKKKGYLKSLAELTMVTVAPAIFFRALSTGRFWVDDGDDPWDWRNWTDEWEDWVDGTAEYVFGGVPLFGFIPIRATRFMTNRIREWRGRKAKKGGYMGISPVIGMYESVLEATQGDKKVLEAARVASQAAGLPGWTGVKRAFAAVTDKDLAAAVWPKYLRQDAGVFAAMEQRTRSSKKEERTKFQKWYGGLGGGDKKRFARYAQETRRRRLQQTAEKRRKDAEKGVKK